MQNLTSTCEMKSTLIDLFSNETDYRQLYISSKYLSSRIFDLERTRFGKSLFRFVVVYNFKSAIVYCSR